MIHPLVVAPHKCGLPVAMLFLAAGGAAILSGATTMLVLAARVIIR